MSRSYPLAPPAGRGKHRRGSDQPTDEEGAQPLRAALIAVHGSIIEELGLLRLTPLVGLAVANQGPPPY